jgi:hypothetical protein
MKKILAGLVVALVWLYLAFPLGAQDTSPRGPSEWSPRNWLGFFIQITLFLLAVFGIYTLATSGGELEEEGGEREEVEKAD